MKTKKSYKDQPVSTGRVDKQPTTMDQLFGFDTGSKFGTLNYEEYQDRLESMTLSELQDEARKINCPPLDDKERLRKTLKNEFRIYASNYYVPTQPKPITKEVSKVVKDLMAEGK